MSGATHDLKHTTLRGGFAKLCSQAANFTLRLSSLMILGRLLSPSDFGLVGMVMAVIGVLNLFRDFGLSPVSLRDILKVLSRPLLSGLTAAVLPLALVAAYGHVSTPIVRLMAGGTLFAGVYAGMLLGVMRQKAFYLDLLRGFRQRPAMGEKALASA